MDKHLHLCREAALRALRGLPPDEWAALTTLAILADSDGRCGVGQAALAQAMGIGLPAANARLRRLSARTVSSAPLVRANQTGRRIVYDVLPASGFDFAPQDESSLRDDMSAARHPAPTGGPTPSPPGHQHDTPQISPGSDGVPLGWPPLDGILLGGDDPEVDDTTDW